MREAIVAVGPRAAGKSTYCEKVAALDPSVVLVSRDRILIDLVGSTYFDPYSGAGTEARRRMWVEVEKHKQEKSFRLILDTWTGRSAERRQVIRRLRRMGARKVIAWYFVTPVEQVEEWFWQKPGIAKASEMGTRSEKAGLIYFSEDAPSRDHALYHKQARSIDSDGFDKVIRINPLVTKPEHMLQPKPLFLPYGP